MDFGKSVSFFMVLMMAWFGVSSGVLYKVGDSYGWCNESKVDYKTWASSKQFHLGDRIHFEYDPKVDNVVRVTHWDFRACDATNPISVMNSGNETILVRNPHSHLYYISSAPGHCEAGQKVDIRVYRRAEKNMPPPPSPEIIPDESSACASLRHSSSMARVATLIFLVAIGVFVY